ncbi:hypothetical protein EMIHUDRAFT_235276 [Emiliania huxleyi CCMP1516]|uniref:Major facilitator superfamily (MFS) profile domain-containing protein n=2 Tax=Emiliania huxleyi TaxID=2903 RepID=A0A0D3JX34_EMIH1|nr:hypothetical protein EMIHUDRAFT_235276 [Emiliania huxleyi CCMP1516]EOD28069.1 hypothetical protein EMIHUDRAFT_235276 [Emiliania huxleyi CCMP1516]|eukprot:XP_005780498.1 hypothetical protein EMIHUDRAFT_235276 [Emiliania huxleyi CCMP1516]
MEASANSVRSPTSSALLREPLLKSSGSKVTLRIASSSSQSKLPKIDDEERAAAKSFVQQLRQLPNEVYVVLLVDFLNSYRSFGFRAVQYQYLTNEFGLSDLEAGSLLGMQAWLLVVFGILGAMLVDAFGVRATALSALSVSVVSRGLLAFGRSRETMTFALLGLSPFGEAVLSTGIYTVALKKLTTRANRAFAFGIQYGVFNLSGALADGRAAAAFPTSSSGGYSSPPPFTPAELASLRDRATAEERTRGFLIARAPKAKPPLPSLAPSPIFGRANVEALEKATSPKSWLAAASASLLRAAENIRDLCALREFWRALWLSICLILLSKQWGDMDQLLPAFLERHFGVNSPIFTIHSINMWVCMVGPSVAASLTAHLDDFRVMLPGMWLMAFSPVWLAYDPGIPASITWVFLLSVGEVIWSPRQSAWVANLAPDGREGVFLALLSLKTLVTALPSTMLNGWLNMHFQPNCESCRDTIGHFCSESLNISAGDAQSLGVNTAVPMHACRAEESGHLCVGGDFSPRLVTPLDSSSFLQCPSTCVECPGWESHASEMWFIVLICSISSPLMVSLSLRFLRGETTRPRQRVV